MARLIYSLLFYAAQPLVWLRLWWRGRHQPDYQQHIGERYGFYPQYHNVSPDEKPAIWLHAVSVGETRAAEPLIEALLASYPEHTLLLTHMTPTGRDTGKMYLERHPERVQQCYLPYDLPDAAARFVDHFRPQIGLFMETEIWPNLIAAAKHRNIPLALINARLSARSQRSYARFGAIIRPALGALDLVAAQTAADGERLTSVGARTVQISGNLKFDVSPAPEKIAQGRQWRQHIGPRPVWLAASTREGEEALILNVFEQITVDDLLLILVPRHPQRFNEVSTLIESHNLSLARRSRNQLPTVNTKVWLGDSMSEMVSYYSAADLALIGGSLLPFGGQNLIEAAACGCPLLLGPHTFNFTQAANDAVAAGAAKRIGDPIADIGELIAATTDILNNAQTRTDMKQKAIAFSQSHQGATARTMALLEPLLKS